MVDAFLSRLTVFPIAKSRVLQIEFSSKDPALAARGANTVAELFLEAQQQAKRDEAKAASAWLSVKIDELRGKVAEADSKVEAFRAGSGLLAGANGMTVPSQQLADMTTQLATARSNQASAAAKAQSLRTMLHDGRLDEIPQVTKDELLRRYVEQRVALKAQIAQELRTLLPEHPRMKELNGELAGLDAEIRIEADKTVAALESDAKLAAADVDSLSAALARQAKTVATGNADDVRLRSLQLDAKTAGDQLESYMQKHREAVAREAENAAPADARIIATASEPREPTFPKKVPTILLGTLAGFFLSLGAAVAHALLTDTAVTATPELRARTDRATGARPPNPTPRSRRLRRPMLRRPMRRWPSRPQLLRRPHCLRRLRRGRSSSLTGTLTVVALADRLAEIAPKAGGALSALIAGDGGGRAAALALALGRRLATRGRAALIDLGDLPRSNESAGDIDDEDEAIGLAELLDGRAGFAEALHRDRISELDLIPAGVGAVSARDSGGGAGGVGRELRLPRS